MNADNSKPIQQSPSPWDAWIAESHWFWIVLITVTTWKFYAGWKLGLIFDECYYWEWSLHPQACYFDHPPLTAWLIAAGRCLFGHTTLAVRFWAIISGGLLAIVGRQLGKQMFGTAAGNRSGIFLLLAPIFAGNALLMTPDTYLIPSWALAVLCAWKGSRQDGTMAWWVAAGAAAGVGMLDKYTMVLFYVALAGLWISSPGSRGRLFLGILSAAVVSFLFFLPVLWWNSQHEWISFTHQFNHGFHNEHRTPIAFQNLLDYATFLILLVTPLMGFFCFRSASTGLNNERSRYLALFFWTPVLFFGFSAAKAHIEANWPMVAFFTGLILVAGDWARYGEFWRKAAVILLLVVDVGAVAAVSYLLLPKDSPMAITHLSLDDSFIKGFPESEKLKEAISQGFGNLQLRVEEFLGPELVARTIIREFNHSSADFICLSTYQLTGILSFYAPELERVIWLPDHGRARFPWINDQAWVGKTALVAEWPRRGPDYKTVFSDLSTGTPVEIPQIRSPLFISIGRSYDPIKVQNR